jgi:CubicO group peptidase (beta-lactamase class C family)
MEADDRVTGPIATLASDVPGAAQRLAALPWVPGIAVAGILGDRVTVAASGVADNESGREVQPDTRFRPGSTTKLLTATLVMQCVDEELVDLDDAVLRYVPELDLADTDRASRVTIRHLLAHSSGIDAGDLFVDTGDGDDCLVRYVEALSGTGFLFEPGSTFSYCNAGTILAGRIVQIVRDRTWEDALRDFVLGPLEMPDTTCVPGNLARETPDAARGHAVTAAGIDTLQWRSDETYTRRAMAPAGGTLVSTAGDLAQVALAHMGSPSVRRILSPASTAMMRELAAAAPGGVAGMRGVGLGWQVWHGSVRAAGANPGQSGLIAIADDGRSGIVALTNADVGINAVTSAIDPSVPRADGTEPRPLELYAGEFESHAGRLTLRVADGGLSAELTGFDDTALLTPLDATTFSSPLGPLAFLDPDDDGRPRLLRARMRVMRRV